MDPYVAAVHRSGGYTFTKPTVERIELVAGIGVEGDVHAGVTVRHRSRVARDPTQPNLRQVHLIHGELHDELAAAGFVVAPGAMGENVTTRGIDLLGLATGTRLLPRSRTRSSRSPGCAIPCAQLDGLQSPGSWPRCSTTTPTVGSCARRASWASCSRAARWRPATRSASSHPAGRSARSNRCDARVSAPDATWW